MAENNNPSQINTNIISKPAMITDLNASYISNEQYSYARNAVRNSREGDLGTISNEPSNVGCIKAPYQVIGLVPLDQDEVLVFSTNNITSEIGLGNYRTCSYKTLNNNSCLNFSTDHIITGVAKKDFNKETVVTFTDKYNPVRRIELNNIATINDCNDILLFKNINQPCIEIERGYTGSLPKGVYSVAIAYSIDNQIFSDWISITNRLMLDDNNSIDVELTDLDQSFDSYSVALIANYVDPVTKGATKVAKIIGNYSTKIKKISISDTNNDSYQNILLSSLVIKKRTWSKAGIISSNSQYLLLGDLVSREEENYQLKAFDIISEYVVTQVPLEYYKDDGKDVGYYRDENYDFYIEGIYISGEHTDKFHIPGRAATSTDRSIVSNKDVYEYDKNYSCKEDIKVERWQVENTAGRMIPIKSEFFCNRRDIGFGSMGYFESTELYEDNKKMFGDNALTPIRFHKFPDESRVPRYSVISGKTYINVLGIRFSNIPEFDSPDIVGYKITRSDRKGGNGTVVARGVMSNVRSHNDTINNQNLLYTNYTVNDLSPDVYLSSTQTSFRNGNETNFKPLDTFRQDKFSFYSPHTLFEPRYSLGQELKIESQEVFNVSGSFEVPYNHPKAKLLNQFSFWLASATGFIQSALTLIGNSSYEGKQGFEASVPPATMSEFNQIYHINSVADLVGLDIVSFVTDAIKAGAFNKVGTALRIIITTIGSLGIKIPYSVFAGIEQANQILNTIYNFTGYTDYALQYNAIANPSYSIPQREGNKRRFLTRKPVYIPSDIVSVDEFTYNNQGREPIVLLETNGDLPTPDVIDNSRGTMSTFGICGELGRIVNSTGSMFYVTNKVTNPNQYGQLGSAQPVSMHSCVLTGETTPTLYGGDCIIAQMSFQKKMKFFRQDLTNSNFTDGVEYDYRLYRGIGYPRFWMDSTRYDFSEILSKNVVNFASFSRTTAGKYNLDCSNNVKSQSISRIENSYFYTSNNCLVNIIVECDYNIWYRENPPQKNVSELFRSDKLSIPETFEINRVFSDIYTTEIYNQQQRTDFDPDNTIPTTQSNAVIYSLPSFNLQAIDNWQYFLPANYFSFRESDFGSLTSIHKLDQDRLIFMFSRSSPYISMGRDFLELEQSGRKITIGDGGLFAQQPREILPTDNNYGASTSRYAFSNTHLGRLYPSSNQGRIINYTEGLEDITRQGLSFWCKNYMPIQLYEYYPEYTRDENPVSGVGYLTVFDSYYETFYVTKRDFIPKEQYVNDITYSNNSFYYRGNKIPLRSIYFEDISWTLSYSPLDKSFVSYHDWHPDLVLQTDNHFLTVKGDTLYKHNESYESFCNFYGVQQPFVIEYVASTGQTVETLRSIEYFLEVYKYKNKGRDRFHMLNENFDTLIVRNTEQISPLLNIVKASSNPEENLQYPKKKSNISYDILSFKEENKYRINQFWDTVKDRGEFSTADNHLFPTDASGYKSVINPIAIDVNKPEEQRKKFRHYLNYVRLISTNPGQYKFIFKFSNNKQLISFK